MVLQGAPQQPRNVSHLQPHPQAFLRSYLSGSLPNVNQIAAHPHMELHVMKDHYFKYFYIAFLIRSWSLLLTYALLTFMLQLQKL